MKTKSVIKHDSNINIVMKLWNILFPKHKWERYFYHSDTGKYPEYKAYTHYFSCPKCKSKKVYVRESKRDWHRRLHKCLNCGYRHYDIISEAHPLSYMGL